MNNGVFFGVIAALCFVGVAVSLIQVFRLYIIQSVWIRARRWGRGLLGRVVRRVGGGVEYWRGRVGFGGVEKQGAGWVYAAKFAGKHGLTFREAAALCRLAVGLPAHAERGCALGGAGVDGGKGRKEGWHGSLSVINKARGRVVVTRDGVEVQYRLPLCQFVVDGSKSGQLNLPIAAE